MDEDPVVPTREMCACANVLENQVQEIMRKEVPWSTAKRTTSAEDRPVR